jgi:hypothetical protein
MSTSSKAVADVWDGATAGGTRDGPGRPLIIRLIIQTIRRDRSGAVWTDEASNLSRPDPSGADQIDAEHQPTDLAGWGFESLAARQTSSLEVL